MEAAPLVLGGFFCLFSPIKILKNRIQGNAGGLGRCKGLWRGG